jgi:hypothetical protein
MNAEIKWVTADNNKGTATLKQHAFISATRKRQHTMEEYPGNRALCNHRSGLMNEDEEFEDFDKIESEPQTENCCKKCKRLAKVKTS